MFFALLKRIMDFINFLIDNYNIPILIAFLLGVLTSISPCPLATNITAIAYISKEIKTAKHTLLSGIFYTLGRGASYTILATLIYFGLSSFQVSSIFQGWGDKILGPVLIITGLLMFGVIKINFSKGGEKIEKIKIWLSQKGFTGSFLLGTLFALAFCPYSGVLFFGVLIPLVLKSTEGLLLPPRPARPGQHDSAPPLDPAPVCRGSRRLSVPAGYGRFPKYKPSLPFRW